MDLKRSTAFAIGAMLLVAACGGGGGTASPSTAGTSGGSGVGGAVEGEVYVTGSSTVEPISLAVSEEIAATSPDFSYVVEGPGTSDGFEIFCTGEADVNDASRPIREEETATCTEAGVEPVELKVAFDGITVFTSPDTALDCLTFADLYALFGPESDDFTTWEEAQTLATELGSTTRFPTGNLAITAPGEESGTYGSFIEIVMADTAEARVAEGAIPEERAESMGTHYTPSPNDNVIVENVSGTPNSLGFAGFSFYENNADRLKAVAIDAGEGCVEPSTESIADGSYPISRPLFIYPNAASDNPALAGWVDFYLSDAGIQKAADVGYVPLPAEEIDATRQAWEDAKP